MPTTRYYVSSVAAPISPAVAAAWTDTEDVVRKTLQTVRNSTLSPVTYNVDNGASAVSAVGLQAVGPATLPAGPITGTMQGVVGRCQEPFGGGRDAFLKVVIRVVSADGLTVRGTLADVENPTKFTGAHSTRTVAAALTPVTAQAGDRLVIEFGARQAIAFGGSSGKISGNSGSVVDYAFADLVTTDGPHGWVDLILDDPPGPPTGLTAVPVSPVAVDLAWIAPAGATGYDVRVDVGAPVAVGNVLAHTVSGLTPETEYLFEVRATNAAGASAWVPITETTLSGAVYRAVVRVGSHTWDAEAGDPPTYGPILPLSFGWLVPEDSLGFPAQPDPETCSLELVTATAADMAGVDIGTTMRVSIYTSADPARPMATFAGRVGDFECTPIDDNRLRWRILGVGYTTDPGSRPVGGSAWPEESADDRVARIMAEAGYPGWATDPIGTTLEGRGAQETNARAELERTLEAAVTAEGGSNGPARRVLLHPNLDSDGELEPAAPFGGSAVLARVDAIEYVSASLINRNTTWRRTKLLDATWVRIDHPGGPTTYGDPRGPAYPPVSVPVLDPTELADMILDNTPGYRWLTGDALRLELWADPDVSPFWWFYRDPASPPFPWSGRAIVVENIAQAPDGSTTYAGMLAAARVILEPKGRLAIEFRLRPEIPADSTVTMRWIDEPAGATWAQEAISDPLPGGTWFAYRTTPRP